MSPSPRALVPVAHPYCVYVLHWDRTELTAFRVHTSYLQIKSRGCGAPSMSGAMCRSPKSLFCPNVSTVTALCAMRNRCRSVMSLLCFTEAFLGQLRPNNYLQLSNYLTASLKLMICLINFWELWRWWFGRFCHGLGQTRCHHVSVSSFSCRKHVYRTALDPRRNDLLAFQTGLYELLYKIHHLSRKQRALCEKWELEVIKNSLSSDSSDYGSAVDCWTTLFEAGMRIPLPQDLKTFGINNFLNMFLALNSLMLDLWQNLLAQIFFSKSHIVLFFHTAYLKIPSPFFLMCL